MIFGCISASPNVTSLSIVERKRPSNGSEELILHEVVHPGFAGGYFLHPHLPYKTADIYFRDKDDDIIVLLSGALYNKKELYSLAGIAVPVPDPELIARLFMKEGPAFVNELNGDFAVFIFQPIKKQAYLFRDQVGICPMAWFYNNKALFFSSDITGLCQAFSGSEPVNSEYLLGYFKYPDYRKTPCESVKKLLPGHYLEISVNGIDIKKYWEPEKIRVDKKLSYDRMMADLKNLVFDAVKIRYDNRFTAGAHASSGIDSGIVAALARKEFTQQGTFYGFSWSPDDYTATGEIKYDERELVKKFCIQTDIQPVFSDIDSADFQRAVSSYYDNHAFFSEDRIIEQARARNTNLIFSGWGGDEFISTGDRGIEQDLLRELRLRIFFRRSRIGQPKKFIKDQFFYVINPALGILGITIARSFRNDARYIKKPFRQSDRRALRNFYFHSSRHQLHLRLLEFYHLQDRCENWYIMGYRKGVEYRYPLLDKRIIEYMLKVPSVLLCRTDQFRPLLRKIGEGILTAEVLWNFSKNDPVYWEWMHELYKEAAGCFMEEVDVWRGNPDLHFVDFDLLIQDIAKYKDRSEDVDNKVLFRALVYLKAIQEFTLRYRELSRIISELSESG